MGATGYVSTSGDTRKVDVAGDTMTGDLVLSDSSPDTALSAASRGYVDGVAGAAGMIPLTQKGAPGGVATLDGAGLLPHAQLPALAGPDITSGTVAYARLPVGNTASTVAAGDDPRIIAGPASTVDLAAAVALLVPTVDVGAPGGVASLDGAGLLPHAQVPPLAGADITSGTVAAARLPVGTVAGTVAAGDDPRLGDARTPTAHKTSHQTGGTDAITPAMIGAEIAGAAAAVTVSSIGAATPASVTAAVAAALIVPRWQPATAYALNQQVVSPNNDVVNATVAHTSSAAYATDLAKWGVSSTFALKGSGGSALPRMASKVATGQAVKVTFLGDSGLEGNWATTAGTDDAASLFCTDLATRFGVAVTKSNRASSGHCSYWHLMTSVLSPTRFASALADAADLYVISTGHNDIRSDLSSPNTGYPLAASIAAIEHMIRRIRLTIPGADILISDEWPYTGTSFASNTALTPHRNALTRLAAYYGCAFAGFTDALTAAGVTGTNPAVDDVYIWPTGQPYAQHPTSAGGRVWADAMLALLPAGVPAGAVPPAALPLVALSAQSRYGAWTSYVTSAGPGVRTAGTQGYRLVNSWSSAAAAPSTSSTVNDYFDAHFIGTEASIRLDTGAGQGTVKINIDDVNTYASLDLSTYSAGQSRIPFTGLAPGYHRILITILSGSVTFRGLDVLTAPVEMLKHDSTRITYTGTWAAQATDPSRYYGTSNMTSVVNDSLTLDFVGTALSLMGVMTTTNCLYGVTIDGVAQPDAIAHGGAALGSAGIVLASGLPYGRHTAVVSLKSAGRTLIVVGLTVFDETRTERPTLIRGTAKVGETITLTVPLPGVPAVRLTPADAASAVPPYPTARTVTGFTVGGTASALAEWEAESARNAW